MDNKFTHKLQPLARSFMKPFKAAFSKASTKWMQMNPGAKITDYDISGLVWYFHSEPVKKIRGIFT